MRDQQVHLYELVIIALGLQLGASDLALQGVILVCARKTKTRGCNVDKHSSEQGLISVCTNLFQADA
jgi:hypothetical protein